MFNWISFILMRNELNMMDYHRTLPLHFTIETKYDSFVTSSNQINNGNGNFCDGFRNLAAEIAKNEC